MIQHFNNGEEYATALVTTIYEADATAPEPMPIDLLEYWCNEITDECINRYNQYVNGNVDDYHLCNNDIENLLKQASLKLVSESLSSLVEKGAVKMSIGDDGEIYYSAADKI